MADPRRGAGAREARLAGAAAGLGVAALTLPVAFLAVVGDDGPTLCPFLLATGLPCPFCGGTRALAAAARGNLGDASRFNVVWPVVAVVLVAAGLAGLAAAWRGRTPLTGTVGRLRSAGVAHPRVRVAVLVTLAAVPWGTALAHRDAISGDGTAATRDALVALPTARHDGRAMTTVPPPPPTTTAAPIRGTAR